MAIWERFLCLEFSAFVSNSSSNNGLTFTECLLWIKISLLQIRSHLTLSITPVFQEFPIILPFLWDHIDGK